MRAAFPTFLIGIALTLSQAHAAGVSLLDDPALTGANRYERCLVLVKDNARNAVAAAEAWHGAGGGAAALHCEALALTALHRFGEAALKLDQAAMIAPGGERDLRIALYDQAGNAWLLAGNPEKAEASISTALALSPHDEDILFDRARARAARKDWSGAETDLTKLLQIDGDRADAWVLRASARHAEGRRAEAAADIGHALAVYPDYPEALVERGTMKLESGDAAGARADWQTVIHDEPDGDAANAARQRLAAMAALPPAPPAKPAGK
ncbi:MAG TPA: tetratricopeptide repeat protein [Rhizomicrobium sp.]|nr:tetratricopeptide repeat protein [Rhizomicrobium sp.]